MLIKINKKPIHIDEDADDEKPDWILFAIKCVAYFFIAYLLDYVCYTFFYMHPLPWIYKLFQWIGGIL